MIARTVRYFKLFYIVAGILLSNEEICETVDQIQIAPRIEVKELLQPRKVYRGVEKMSRGWFGKFDILGIGRIRKRIRPILDAFTIWTIPSYLFSRSSNYLSKKLIITSDCDMIYNK